MKTKEIFIPCFRYEQVNKRDDGTIISQKEVIKENMMSALDAFDMEAPPNDCVVLCCREKIDNDYRYCIGIMPIQLYKADFVTVNVGTFTNIPPILIKTQQNKKITDIVENLLSRVFDKLLLLI